MRTYPSQNSTQLLGARVYGVPNPANAEPIEVVTGPPDRMAYVWGRAIGKASEFAHFSMVGNAFNFPPSSGLVALFGQAVAIPTGDKFEFFVMPKQTLYALGSTSSAIAGAGNDVYITYQITYFEAPWVIDESSGLLPQPTGGGGGGGGGRFGPKARFVIR